MHIHSVKKGETVYDIAKAYDTSAAKTVENNGLRNKNKLSVGRELLILTPTRTYTVKRGDTLSGIAMRFGVKLRDLVLANPSHIGNDALSVGEVLSIRSPEKQYGTSVSNGYFYQGCSIDRLREVMPFLTYVTVASVVCGGEALRRIFDDSEAVDTVIKSGRIPLVRIYEIGEGLCYSEKARRDGLIEKMISLAKEGRYAGIVLSAFGSAERDPEGFAEFIMELRKRMIGCDLVLFTEIDETSSATLSDLADGSVLTYDKLAGESIPSFDNGERAVMSDFATRCESSKVFIDIPSLAYDGMKYTSYEDAMDLCYTKGAEIKTAPDTLVSEFEYREGGRMRRVRFESMKNIEAKLKAVYELGFMGISFDIMRTPRSTLMMFCTLYKILSGGGCYSDI